MPSDYSPQLRDYVTRTKASSPLGTSIFVALRLLDPPLIYAILAHGFASHITGTLGFDVADTSIGLSLPQTLIFLMAIGSSVKHVFWILFVSEQAMPAGTGFFLGGLVVVLDVLNCGLSLITIGSGGGVRSWKFIVGVFLYTLGLYLETASEIQRRNFKRTSAGRGKPYGGGLFAWARNINYGGHILWKTGFALVSGGWIWAAVIGGTLFYDFATRGVPVLDRYCEGKVGLFFRSCESLWELTLGQYGAAWKNIKSRVRYRLLPGIY